MAVCAVGPPEAVQSPRMRFGIKLRGVGRSQIVGHQDHRMVGQTRRTVLGASEQAQDALADIMKIRSPLREAFILNLFQLHRTPFNGMLPGPCCTVPGFDLCARLPERSPSR